MTVNENFLRCGRLSQYAPNSGGAPLMSNHWSIAVTRLSTRLVIGCLLVLSAADSASAQSLTANGTTGALSIIEGVRR